MAAAFGGLAEAPEPAPESLGKGAALDQERIRTEFLDAVVRPGGGDGIGVTGRRYLRVHLRVTNLSDETVSAYSVVNSTIPTVRADGATIKSPDQSGGDGPRIAIPGDGRSYDQLHPRVPMTVVMAFELPAEKPAPRTVEIDAGTFELVESFFHELPEWRVVSRDDAAAETDGPQRKPRIVPWIAAKVELPVRVEESA